MQPIYCDIPGYLLDPNECVGDILGKINFNFLNFDTDVCNLKDLYTNQNNDYSIINILSGLEILVNQYNIITNPNNVVNGINVSLNDALTNRILQAATTVTLLSSFWGSHEFSISLPINAASLTTNDYAILAPTLSTISTKNIDLIANTTLKSFCQIELDTNYSAYQYLNNTIVNVSVFLYNLIPSLNDLADLASDPLIKINYTPTNVFSFPNRSITATYNRDNVHFTTGLILRFYAQDKKWIYMGYIHDTETATAKPNKNVQAIYPKPVTSTQTQNNESVYLRACEPIDINKWYSTDAYVYASGLYTGTSSKLGTITLTLKTPQNRTTVFTHKAQGYNPLTNTGGTDVYLEYDGNVIKAYEQYPIMKTLVKSWPNPYAGQKGINFKYTFDTKGITPSVCASKPNIY